MPVFLTNDFAIVDPDNQTKQLDIDCSGLIGGFVNRFILKMPNATTGTYTVATLENPNQVFTVSQSLNQGALLTRDDPNTILFITRASAGATQDLTTWRNQAGVALLTVNKNGHFTDNLFTVCDSTDIAKRIHFQLEGISSGSDRTITWPNSDGTPALTGFAQTWSALQSFNSSLEVVDTPGSVPRVLMSSSSIELRYNTDIATIKWIEEGVPATATLAAAAINADRTWTLPNLSIIIAGSAAALTSGRVPVVGTGGILTDDSDLTFATDTLTATKIVASTSIKAGTAAGYISSDGSTGATGSFTTVDLKTVTVKDGIIVSIT